MRPPLALAAALLAAAPAAAQADGRIVAVAPNRYAEPEVAIGAGERVVFQNQDVARHDVVAEASGPSGEPRFRSPLVDPGGEAPVAGVEALEPGEYRFLCSVHSSMRGVLRVAGPPRTDPPAPSADASAPVIGVAVHAGRVARVRRRGLAVTVRTDEPAAVRLVARARVRGRSVRLGRAELRLDRPGEHAAVIALTRRAKAVLRRKARVAVRVDATATDAAGNAATATARRRLGD